MRIVEYLDYYTMEMEICLLRKITCENASHVHFVHQVWVVEYSNCHIKH